MDIDSLIREARLQRSSDLETLKLVKAEFLKAMTKPGRNGKENLSPEEELQVLRSMVKSRKDSIEKYREVGRIDLAEKEEKELEIISKFIPKEPDRKEILEKLKNEISELQMGPAMGIAKKLFPSVSGATLSGIVKEILGK